MPSETDAVATPPSALRAWYVLAVLFTVYICSTADRHILSILAPAIKADLQLSDTQIGLLTGPAIAVLYGIISVPVAHLADRIHRVRLLALCLFLWSLCTGAGALAGNALQLSLSRIGVSAAEGGGMPTSASIIADYFPPERRPLALTLLSMSAMVGIFVCFSIGGAIEVAYGWRTTLVVAAVPGLLLCALLLGTVREPRRGATDAGRGVTPPATGSLAASLKLILGDRLFRSVLIGASLSTFASAGCIAWGPTFAMRRFGADAAEVGGQLGLMIALLGGAAMLLGGIVTDRILVGRGRAATFRVVAVTQLVGLPMLAVALTTGHLLLALALLGGFYGIMHFFVAAYWGAASLMPAAVRATTSAVGVLTLIVVGTGLAPPLIGLASDLLAVRLGEAALAWAMTVLLLSVLLSSAAFLRAAQVADATPRGIDLGQASAA